LSAGVSGNGYFQTFDLNGTERMRITSTGSVGIGTASPSGALHIAGSSFASSRIYLQRTSGALGTYSMGVQGADNTFGIVDEGQGNLTRFLINSAGSVGIGTTSPSGAAGLALAINGGASQTRIALKNSFTGDAAGDGFQILLDAGAADVVFENREPASIIFATNTTERMRITSGGAVGIGKTSSITGVDIYQAAADVVNSRTGQGAGTATSLFTGWHSASPTTSGTLVFNVTSNGNVTNTNGSYGAISDIKLKENIQDATPKLDDLMKVKIRNYNLIGEETKQIGVIAQELEEIFPAMIDESEDFEEVEVPQLDEEGNEIINEEGEVVTTKERVSKGTTTKSVKYSVFVPMLIKAIQEQQEQIQELKTEIDSLKNQIK
jgi:hypothetical protein